MQKTLEMLQKFGFGRAKANGADGDSAFEMRMKKIDRVRQTAPNRGQIFRNRPTQSKA
jgi:hypothetical protein